jgi:copper chaperone NosL
MTSKITGKGVRIIIFIASFLLLGALKFPIWKIDLIAPQYPEGLTLEIWSDKLGGDVETVNGLNHYIGMKKLKEDEFVEFKVLPGLILFFSITGFLVGFINRRKVLYAWMVLFILFAAVSMADFYYWEYNYGHNLDPTAPIQVPGMAYQPPFIGYKQMLNFVAFSIPHIGGWFFIGCGVFMFIGTIIEWKSVKKLKIKSGCAVVSCILLFFVFSSCTTEVKPINYGKDDCDFCKMIIMDNKFAVEIISKKGKIFMMDDLFCARNFIEKGELLAEEVKFIYINNYSNPGELIDLQKSIFVKNQSLKSPMNGNTAAFLSKELADNYIISEGGEIIENNSIISLK